MLKLPESIKVYLYSEATDMRKSFDSLSVLIEETFSTSVLSGGVYVFFSRKKDKVKLMYWDNDGYCLWYKRLEAGVFKVRTENTTEIITGVDLKLLLEGLDLSRIKLRKKVQNRLPK